MSFFIRKEPVLDSSNLSLKYGFKHIPWIWDSFNVSLMWGGVYGKLYDCEISLSVQVFTMTVVSPAIWLDKTTNSLSSLKMIN